MFRRKKPKETDLNSELRFHIEELVDAKVAAGIEPAEARRQALLEFGGAEQVREDCRDVHRIALWDHTIANLKAAFRFIRKSPVFSLAVILTMALGIGANSAVFSAVNAVVLRPLPFPNAEEIVSLHQRNTLAKGGETPVAPIRIEDWNRLNNTFTAVSGYYTQDVSETSGSLPEKLTEGLVAPRFLQTWGISPIAGRDFAPDEERFGGPNAALISDHLWRRLFHADTSVIGKQLHFGKYASTVVGVLPANFIYPDSKIDFWAPSPADAPFAQSRDSTWYFTFGRLKPRISVARAQANLAAVQAQLGRQFPKTDASLRIDLQPFKDSVVGSASRGSLYILFGSVTLLLVIACTNIAALLLARMSERGREIAIRYSLGASRLSVIFQLLTESLVLAVAGSVAGLGIAWAGAAMLRSSAAALPRSTEISLDWSIVLYALASAFVCTVLFGLVPALQATRRTIAGSLSGGSRTQVSARHPLQWLLVGVQVALAVTLLVGASLLLRSFQALGRVAPGFNASHVLSFRVSGSWGETADMKALNARVDRELDAIRNIPGVLSAASSASLPGFTGEYPLDVSLVEGHSSTDKITSDSKTVSAAYFETMQIPVLSGRACQPGRLTSSVVVNRSFVDTFMTNQPVVGRHLRFPGSVYQSAAAEIVGIAADARENGVNQAPVPTIYWCLSAPDPSPYILVRTAADPAAMSFVIRRKIHDIEPSRSVFDVVPLEEILFNANGENRFRTMLLTLFALTAIALASLGLYGTLSYFVSLRHREVGLRMALGALPKQILGSFFVQGLAVAAFGCFGGLCLALALSRFLSSMLWGITRSDAFSYLTVTGLVLLVAAIASVLPAARAAHVDPMNALRDQ